jgi:hypothetical protein
MGLNLFEKNVRKMTAPGRNGGVYGATGDNIGQILASHAARMAAQKRAREATDLRKQALEQQNEQNVWDRGYKEDTFLKNLELQRDKLDADREFRGSELDALKSWRSEQSELKRKNADRERERFMLQMEFEEKQRQDELKRYQTSLKGKGTTSPSAGGGVAPTWQTSVGGTRYYKDANGKIHIA